MTNYRNGAELERAVKRLFEANGYYVVRAAGSKGAADLVCLKRGETVLVQCKLDGYLLPAERRIFSALGWSLDARPVVASWWKQGRAARKIHLATIADAGDGMTWLHDWSPDWAMEET